MFVKLKLCTSSMGGRRGNFWLRFRLKRARRVEKRAFVACIGRGDREEKGTMKIRYRPCPVNGTARKIVNEQWKIKCIVFNWYRGAAEERSKVYVLRARSMVSMLKQTRTIIPTKRFRRTSTCCVGRLCSSRCTAVSGNTGPPTSCRPTVGKTLKRSRRKRGY